MKMGPLGAELFHADGRTHMTKLVVTLRSFANGINSGLPRLEEICSVVSNHYILRNNSRLFPHTRFTDWSL